MSLELSSITASGTSAADTVANALSSRRAVQATPKDSTTSTSGTASSSSSSAASSSSDITANDFLTLLVSELKNQDPTQPTDPNQYITQLAQVNSLQQLVSINQGIGTLDSAVSTTPSTPTAHSVSGINSNSSSITS
jgi:flagellar basal-body rod modification protein FlgD